MHFFFTFIILASHSYAFENELPKISKHSDAIVSPIHAQLVQHAPTSFFSKVNPITGEYVEEETDLEVPGCEPLSFRRFYGHFNPPDPRYEGWRINPATSLVANFQWKKSPVFLPL